MGREKWDNNYIRKVEKAKIKFKTSINKTKEQEEQKENYEEEEYQDSDMNEDFDKIKIKNSSSFGDFDKWMKIKSTFLAYTSDFPKSLKQSEIADSDIRLIDVELDDHRLL